MTMQPRKKNADPVVSDQAGRLMPVDPLGTNAPRNEVIRRKAYDLYERRGRIDGKALDDWLQAEQQTD